MRAFVERRLRCVGGRLVQVAHGLRKSPQPPRLPCPGRQRFGEIRGVARKRAMDELAQRVLGQACGRRIDGCQTVRQRRAERDDVKARMDDLQPEVAFTDVAESAHALARRERLLLAGIEMKEAQHELRFAILEQTDQLPPRPVLDLGVGNRPFDL